MLISQCFLSIEQTTNCYTITFLHLLQDNDVKDNKEGDIFKYLAEVYPNKSQEELNAALKSSNGDAEDAIIILLDEEEFSSPPENTQPSACSGKSEGDVEFSSDIPHNEPVNVILKSYAYRVIDSCEDTTLEVNREEVWQTCLSFYKVALKHPERLKKNLLSLLVMGNKGLMLVHCVMSFSLCV